MWHKGFRWHHVKSDIQKEGSRTKHPGRWGIVEHQIFSIKVLFKINAKRHKQPDIKLLSSESKTQLVNQRKQSSYRRAYIHMVVVLYKIISSAYHERNNNNIGKQYVKYCSIAWWRHEMETFAALLTVFEGNSRVTGEFAPQRPVTQSFDVFFDPRLSKRLRKPSRHWWFETPSRLLWRHCNGSYIGENDWLEKRV